MEHQQYRGQRGQDFSFKGSIVTLTFLCWAQTTKQLGYHSSESFIKRLCQHIRYWIERSISVKRCSGKKMVLSFYWRSQCAYWGRQVGLVQSKNTGSCHHLSRGCCTNYRSLVYWQLSFERLVGVTHRKKGWRKMSLTQSDMFCYYFINYYYHYHYYSSLDVTDIFAIFVVFFLCSHVKTTTQKS